MTRPLIPFVQNGYYASRNWIPLVKGNGFTTSGGGEQEEVWETASGSIATFTAVPAPLRQLSVAVEPVQSGTGDPSPTNVRPITGWDSVTVNRTGKNLLDPALMLNYPTCYTINPNGEVTVIAADTRSWSTMEAFPIKAGTYTFSSSALAWSDIRLSSENYATVHYLTTAVSSTTFTLAEDGFFKVKVGFSGPTYPFTAKWQIELGSTATAYEPYNGNTYTIQLGETVYGGTLDVVNGKMTVDRAMVDLSTLAWQYNTTWAPVPRFYTTTLRDETIHYPGLQYPDGTLCSSYIVSKNTTVSTVGNDKTIGIGGDGYIYIQDASYDGTTLNDFKAALSGVQFVYMLATPFELTLTPEQISTLQGTNNVWSDAGDVTVEYRAQ